MAFDGIVTKAVVSELTKAQELGVAIISEQEFNKMIEK